MESTEILGVERHDEVDVGCRTFDSVEIHRDATDEDVAHALVVKGFEQLYVYHRAAAIQGEWPYPSTRSRRRRHRVRTTRQRSYRAPGAGVMKARPDLNGERLRLVAAVLSFRPRS
jgi:hypothetical protein